MRLWGGGKVRFSYSLSTARIGLRFWQKGISRYGLPVRVGKVGTQLWTGLGVDAGQPGRQEVRSWARVAGTPRTSNVGENVGIPMTSGCSHPHIISGDILSPVIPHHLKSEHGLQGPTES